jgi:hypothetical protein
MPRGLTEFEPDRRFTQGAKALAISSETLAEASHSSDAAKSAYSCSSRRKQA